MKNILLLTALLNTYSGYTQNKLDSNSFYFLCKNEYKIEYSISNNYIKYDYRRAFIPTYVTYSCMPYFFKDAIQNKNLQGHYVIYFEFNAIASSKYDDKFIKNYLKKDYSNNTNYLGGGNCQIERKQGLMNIYSNSDFKKFNADTILCVRLDSTSREKNDPVLNDFMYVIIHKENIGDIYVGFAYLKKYESEVIDEVKNLWKIIKFKL